jgi:hypothetical protein
MMVVVLKHMLLLGAENTQFMHLIDSVTCIVSHYRNSALAFIRASSFRKAKQRCLHVSEMWAAGNCLQPSVYYITKTVFF